MVQSAPKSAAVALRLGLSALLAILGGSSASPVVAAVTGEGEAIFLDDFEAGDYCEWAIGAPECPGFVIEPTQIIVASGEERNVCYYLHAGNAALAGIRRLTTIQQPNVRFTALYTTYVGGVPTDVQPPGTIASCSPSFTNSQFRRLSLAQTRAETLVLPTDDGEGSPVGIELLAGQPIVLEMHALNETVDPIPIQPRLAVHLHPQATSFTRTATYTAFLTLFNLGSGVSSHSDSCPVPASVEFWWFSTWTHGLATEARVSDGAETFVITDDWTAPAVARPVPFHDFGVGGSLTYGCTWDNDTGQPVGFGESYASDEFCSALAYYVPGNLPRVCVDHTLLP